jgi:hypothetical protein
MKTGCRADTEYETQGAATMNRQHNRAVALATVLAAIFLFSTCQQFFTTSLAKPLARDSYTIPADISVADAISLLDAAIAEGDATMAAALVPSLYAAAADAPAESAAYNEAANALVAAVVLSSGVGPAITSMATLFISTEDVETDAFIDSALEAISTVSLSDGERAALLLIAGNPPAEMSSADAYSVALALVADAFSVAETDMANFEDLGDAEVDALAATPSMMAALDLLDYASTMDPEESSLFGMLLLEFNFNVFDSGSE